MRRRTSTRGGKPVKARRRRAAALKRGNGPKTARHRSSSAAGQAEKVSRLTRERNEALEQQAAAADVLKVISRSTFDLQSVLDKLTESAARLCDAEMAGITREHDGAYYYAAVYNYPSELHEFLRNLRHERTRGTVTGRALLDGKTIHLPDVTRDPEYKHELAQKAGFRTVLGVPLLREGTAIGVIVLTRSRRRPFNEKQIELVTTFADQAVIAIENVRLFEAEQQRTRELTELLEQQTATSELLSVISQSKFELQPILQSVVDTAARLCRAEQSMIYRLEGGVYRFAAAASGQPIPPAYLKIERQTPISPGPGTVVGRAAMNRRVVLIEDAWTDPLYEKKEDAKIGGVHSMIGVPLMREGQPIGVMGLARTRVDPFAQREIDLVTTFADQAVIAIENVRLFEAEQQRTRELTESLEQQTATLEVLGAISGSPGELDPVFKAILENAARICQAQFGTLNIYDGSAFHNVAQHNAPPQFAMRLGQVIRPHPESGLAYVARTRQTAHIDDIRTRQPYLEGDKAVVDLADLAGARTLLIVPMLKEGKLIGAIAIYRREVRPFTDKQIELVQNFASQAVIAIENTRLLNELRQRTDELDRSVGELRALGEVSQAVNSTLELETVLSTIVAKAVQLSSTEAGAIYVFDNAQREFHLRATYGMDHELIEALTQRHIGLDAPNITPAFLEGEPIQVPDLREGISSAANEIILSAGFRALLVTPLVRGEEIVGMLVVRRRTPGVLPQNTIDLIKTFAAQSAVAIENARLFQHIEASLEDLRTAQDRLVQTEKLASLGQLTAGIAHEIKNPLNFVNNFSGVSTELIDELRDVLSGISIDHKARTEINELTDTLRGNLDKVVQHGKRADAIVKNMLLHSRQGSGEHRAVDINALVEESLNLAYHGARAEKQGFNITLERSFDSAAGEVDLFPQEITRALLNLISNGFYAATKRKVEADGGNYEPRLAAATKNLGDRVEIRIRDNGTGIPPEVKEKLFNPFFTTKPAGEGTGLGLSISHDIIVKQHGGSIEVDTQPGEFTEFRIILPRAGASLIKSGERA